MGLLNVDYIASNYETDVLNFSLPIVSMQLDSVVKKMA